MEKTYQITINRNDAVIIIVALNEQIEEFEAIIKKCEDESQAVYFIDRVKDLKKTLETIKGNVYR